MREFVLNARLMACGFRGSLMRSVPFRGVGGLKNRPCCAPLLNLPKLNCKNRLDAGARGYVGEAEHFPAYL